MRGVLVLAVLVLAGCASVSRDECVAGDWAAIGARDGAAGLVAEARLPRHANACARVGVVPDEAAYLRGHAQGLQSFCTPLGGLEAGEAGRAFRDICPAERAAGFREGYELGFAAHRARLRVEAAQRDLAGSQSLAADGTVVTAATDSILDRLALLEARAELARIEREIRAFRAAERAAGRP